jgi:hypothetical protein
MVSIFNNRDLERWFGGIRCACLLQRVVQVDEAGGRIFVFDQDVTRGLFVFDHQGKFLYRFGNKGKGPGEFTEPNVLAISPDE